MMRLKRLFLFGAVLVAATSALADVRSDTQKQFDKYCSAIKHKDVKGIEKILRANFAPTFQFIPKTGQPIGLDKWIEDEKMQASMTQRVKSVSLHIDSAKVAKGRATMQITLSYEGVTKIDPKGKPGVLKYVATSNQTMVQKNCKWWITQMKERKSSTYFNGKPLG